MSQEKVDRYKEEKKNRAKIIRKQKREWLLTKIGMSLVGLALVVWAGVSVYNTVNTPDAEAERPAYTVNTTAIDDYITDINLQ